MKYMCNLHICKVINDKAQELQGTTSHVRHSSVADIQLLMPAEYTVNMLPDMKDSDRHANTWMPFPYAWSMIGK